MLGALTLDLYLSIWHDMLVYLEGDDQGVSISYQQNIQLFSRMSHTEPHPVPERLRTMHGAINTKLLDFLRSKSCKKPVLAPLLGDAFCWFLYVFDVFTNRWRVSPWMVGNLFRTMWWRGEPSVWFLRFGLRGFYCMIFRRVRNTGAPSFQISFRFRYLMSLQKHTNMLPRFAVFILVLLVSGQVHGFYTACCSAFDLLLFNTVANRCIFRFISRVNLASFIGRARHCSKHDCNTIWWLQTLFEVFQ